MTIYSLDQHKQIQEKIQDIFQSLDAIENTMSENIDLDAYTFLKSMYELIAKFCSRMQEIEGQKNDR